MPQIHRSPFNNVRLVLSSAGAVWLSYRIRVEGPCRLNFVNFPMDVQSCRLIFESYSYPSAEVQLHWHTLERPVTLASDKEWTSGDMRVVRVAWWRVQEQYTAGVWDQLHVQIR